MQAVWDEIRAQEGRSPTEADQGWVAVIEEADAGTEEFAFFMGAVMIVDEDRILDNLNLFLKDLSRNNFYGTVELQFVNGELVLVREEKTYKPVVFLK